MSIYENNENLNKKMNKNVLFSTLQYNKKINNLFNVNNINNNNVNINRILFKTNKFKEDEKKEKNDNKNEKKSNKDLFYLTLIENKYNIINNSPIKKPEIKFTLEKKENNKEDNIKQNESNLFVVKKKVKRIHFISPPIKIKRFKSIKTKPNKLLKNNILQNNQNQNFKLNNIKLISNKKQLSLEEINDKISYYCKNQISLNLNYLKLYHKIKLENKFNYYITPYNSDNEDSNLNNNNNNKNINNKTNKRKFLIFNNL
jgi:hypothetical protein